MTNSKPFEKQFEKATPNPQNALIRKFIDPDLTWFGPPECPGFPPNAGTDRALWEVFSGCWKRKEARPCIEDIVNHVADLHLTDDRPSSGFDAEWQSVAKAARKPRPKIEYEKAGRILSRVP